MNQSMTRLFIEQPLALPGSAKYIYIFIQGTLTSEASKCKYRYTSTFKLSIYCIGEDLSVPVTGCNNVY